MYRRNITYPVINIYNYMTMKVIVLESITLNPNPNGTKSFIVCKRSRVREL